MKVHSPFNCLPIDQNKSDQLPIILLIDPNVTSQQKITKEVVVFCYHVLLKTLENIALRK